MEATQNPLAPPPYRYEKFWVRFLAAFLGANIVVLMGQRVPFLQSFAMLAFYKDMLFSFAVALAMLETVYRFTLKLDQSHPWNTNPIGRRIRMLLLCILLPLIIDTALMGAYYYYFSMGQINILVKQRWYTQYLSLAAILMAFVNFYYYSRFKVHEKNTLQEQVRQNEEKMKSKRSYKEKLISEARHAVSALADAVYFYLKDKKVMAVLSNGEDIITPYINIVDVPVSEEHFIPNQSVIVLWDNILRAVKKGQDFEIILKVPADKVIKVSRTPSSIYRKELNALVGIKY